MSSRRALYVKARDNPPTPASTSESSEDESSSSGGSRSPSPLQPNGAQSSPPNRTVPIDDLIAAYCSLLYDNKGIRAMRDLHSDIEAPFSRGERLLQDLMLSHNFNRIVFCGTCGVSEPSETHYCITSKMRSKQSKIVSFDYCQIKPQLQELIETNITSLFEVHQEMQNLVKGISENRRRDLSSCQEMLRNLESDQDFQNGIINVSLGLGIDAFPIFKKNSFGATPIQYLLRDLPSAQRNKKESILLSGILCGSGKAPPAVWNRVINLLRVDLPSSITVGNKQVNIRLSNLHFDLESLRELFSHTLWKGVHGCPYGLCCSTGGTNPRFPVAHPQAQLRSERGLEKEIEAARNGTDGYKACRLLVTPLHRFAPIWSFPLDVLHNISNGVGSKLLSCTLDTGSKLYVGSVSIKKLSALLVSDLQNQPSPRPYNCTGQMAGHERYTNLLYVVPALLVDANFAKSPVTSIFLLLFVGLLHLHSKREFSKEDLELLEKWQNIVAMYASVLLGDDFFTLKSHLLLQHGADALKEFGSMIDNSMCALERTNKILKDYKRASSTRGFGRTELERYVVGQNIIRLLNKEQLTDRQRETLNLLMSSKREISWKKVGMVEVRIVVDPDDLSPVIRSSIDVRSIAYKWCRSAFSFRVGQYCALNDDSIILVSAITVYKNTVSVIGIKVAHRSLFDIVFDVSTKDTAISSYPLEYTKKTCKVFLDSVYFVCDVKIVAANIVTISPQDVKYGLVATTEPSMTQVLLTRCDGKLTPV